MDAPVIQVYSLGKRYRIGARQRYLALRDVLAGMLRAPANWVQGRNGQPSADQHLWALRDVTFDVTLGEVVGLIGRNGAGKTTLLKVLARVTRPTEGFAEVRGRLGSLLEVGTGFHPELTGRENTYLSGAILGMTRREIERKFDEIVEFAEVADFIDTPLKHYSTGMQMRLAFAVAAHLEPEILLVDEVLAVGDIKFQKKCLGKMGEVAQGGRTILFVSHQMNQIRRLCSRAIWIDGGHIRQAGPTAEVSAAYEVAMTSGETGATRSAAEGVKACFQSWEIIEPRSAPPCQLTTLGPVTVKFTLRVNTPMRSAHHGIALFSTDNQLMWAWAADGLELRPGRHELVYSFPTLPLRPGAYFWQLSLWEEGSLVDMWHSIPDMIIATEHHQHPLDQWNGVLNVPCRFSIQA